MPKCQCYKADGTKCTYNAKPGSKYCGVHKDCKRTQAKQKVQNKKKEAASFDATSALTK